MTRLRPVTCRCLEEESWRVRVRRGCPLKSGGGHVLDASHKGQERRVERVHSRGVSGGRDGGGGPRHII